MAIYKPNLLDKFKDFVNGLKGNWDQYEAHVADFEALLADFEAHLADYGQLVATKVIEEVGSNANGRFIRFADGTQICYLVVRENRSDNGKLVTPVTFPASFIREPLNPLGSESVSVQVTPRSAVPEHITGCSTNNISVTGCDVIVVRSTSTSTILHVTAIGRWK